MELLISMTIIGLITVIVFAALRIGIRAWEKGERNVASSQRQRVVLDLVKRQLASQWWPTDAAKRTSLFRGDEKSLEFVSNTSLIPGNKSGLVYVKYVVRSADTADVETLAFYEENRALINSLDDFEVIDEDAFRDLIPEAALIEFAYLSTSVGEEPPEWKQTWDPKTDNGILQAVRITLQEAETDLPAQIIARMKAALGT